MVFEEQGASWALCLARGKRRVFASLLGFFVSACLRRMVLITLTASLVTGAGSVAQADQDRRSDRGVVFGRTCRTLPVEASSTPNAACWSR